MYIQYKLPLKRQTPQTVKIIYNKHQKQLSILVASNQFILIQNIKYESSLKLKFNSLNNNNKITLFNFFLFKTMCCKIKFTGKGYKITKYKTHEITSSLLDLKFNRAHMTIIHTKGVILKKIKKNKFLLFFNKQRFTTSLKNIFLRKIRYANIFTKRGLKITRAVIYKKTGKKSMK